MRLRDVEYFFIPWEPVVSNAIGSMAGVVELALIFHEPSER